MFECYVETIENNFICDYPQRPVAVTTGYGYRVYALGYFWEIVQCTDGTWDLILQDNDKGVKSNYHSLQYLCHCSDKHSFIEIFYSLLDGEYVEF